MLQLVFVMVVIFVAVCIIASGECERLLMEAEFRFGNKTLFEDVKVDGPGSLADLSWPLIHFLPIQLG